MRNFFLLLFIFSSVTYSQSQERIRKTIPEKKLNQKRFSLALGIQSLGFGSSLNLLRKVWYTDYNIVPFHTFNDNEEWLQVDKVGHFTTAYTISHLLSENYKWTGLSNKNSALAGALVAITYLNSLEVLDAYSTGWGFSWGDVAANFSGGFFFVLQESVWQEQRVLFKYSFHQSGLAKYRYDLLGENLAQQLLKDYNGQTYWASINIASFFASENKFPAWLNIAVGYGADGMIGGHSNPIIIGNGYTLAFERFRQYYFSLDIDLRKIKTKSKVLKTVFNAVSFIKIPAPALEWSKNKLSVKPFYF